MFMLMHSCGKRFRYEPWIIVCQYPVHTNTITMSTEEAIISPNVPDLPSKEKKKKSQALPQNGFETNHLTHTHNGKKPKPQPFFFEQISKRPDVTIRIPEIYYAFRYFQSGVHIVIEHIEIGHAATDEQRARAITKLVSVEPPADVTMSESNWGWAYQAWVFLYSIRVGCEICFC